MFVFIFGVARPWECNQGILLKTERNNVTVKYKEMAQPTKTDLPIKKNPIGRPILEAKLFPVPTNRPGSVQRQLDDALIKSLNEITQATEETLARIQEINTQLHGIYQYVTDSAKDNLVCCDEEETKSNLEKLTFITKEWKLHIIELTDKCDKAKRDVKELQKTCSDNMTKHISRLAICPFSGELIIPCATTTSTDCTGCGHIFPGNYNYVPGTM